MSSRHGACVGVTNARLNTAKRGVAVELGRRVAAVAGAPVCLVAADPTDRDVERHLPGLVATWGEPARMEVTRGPHHLEVANFPSHDLCVVSVSDREGIEHVLPALQERFPFVIIDAPSRAGIGVGIADGLLDWLDGLVVATGLLAGELAETRRYVEHVESEPGAWHVDVRVLAIGIADESGLAPAQLGTRLAALPVLGHVPRLGGGAAPPGALDRGELDAQFRPVLDWLIGVRSGRESAGEEPRQEGSTDRHIVNELYRANELHRAPVDR